MADATKSYGWAGKILRVNVSDGSVSTQPTDPYKKLIGGMGIANKIMYDEVPAGTDPLSPENKVVFAVGPLTASGTPLAGRTTLASLSTFSKDHLVVDAHCGGMIGARIKQAGYDAIIVEGKADHPVYINVNDDDVKVKDARSVWGMGTRATTEALCRREGVKACVAAIGPAGENLLPYSCVINSRNHSAGAGVGAVLGSKNVKALVVQGTQPVRVKDPQKVAKLSDYMLRDIIGSNNNHVVPSTQQEWAEYYDEGSRWTAHKGLTWGAAEDGPIDTGEPKPGELNTVGYRCMKSTFDLKDAAEKYTVKMNGCHGCPIHCHSDLYTDDPAGNSFKGAGNTCVANNPWGRMKIGPQQDNDTQVRWNMVSSNVADDLGLWCNYGQLWRDIGYCYNNGIFEKYAPEGYAAIDWDKLNRNDASFISDLFGKIAANDSDIALVGHGPYVWCPQWDSQDWFDDSKSTLINYRGWPVHHAIECFGQVGGVYNMLFNRDDMIHSAVNFQGCGLPIEIKRQIAKEVWGGEDAIDEDKSYTPMNDHKANFAWWSVVTDVLHDSLTLCNWVWPMTMSPTASRDYRGDLDLEAKFYNAVTGEDLSTEDLYHRAAAIMTLQRANTVRGMVNSDGSYGDNNLREHHDVITNWAFDKDPDIPAFSEGTDKLDRDDFQKALTMVYGKFGWDEQKGCPTAECLDTYELSDVKEELQGLGLLP